MSALRSGVDLTECVNGPAAAEADIPAAYLNACEMRWGISEETVRQFGLVFQGNPVVIGMPYKDPEGRLVGMKRRTGIKENRRFWMDKCVKDFRQWPWQVEKLAIADALGVEAPVIITEGETDCMRLTQELSRQKRDYLVIAMPGLNKWEDGWKEMFGNRQVYVVLDNDQARKERTGYDDVAALAKIDKASEQARSMKLQIRKALGSQVSFVELPASTKDICEYFLAGHSCMDFTILMGQADSREKERLKSRQLKLAAASEPHTDQLKHLLTGSGFIQLVVDAFGPTTEAPEEFLVGAALQMVSSAVGDQLKVRVGAQTFGLNLYTLLIGPSGLSRKSSSMGIAKKIVRQSGVAAVLGGGFTAEGLEKRLRETPNALMVIDEFGRLTANTAKSYGADIPHVLTELYGGEAHPRVLSATADSDDPDANKPFPVSLNVLAASTYSWLNGLDRNAIESGYLARFLILFCGRSTKDLWEPPDVELVHKQRILQWMKRFKLECHGEASWAPGVDEEVIKPWYIGWKRRLEGHPLGDTLGPFWSRYDTLARKLAVILEICENPGHNPQVSADSLMRAHKAVDGVLEMLEFKLRQGYFGEPDQMAVTRSLTYLSTRDQASLIELASAMQLPIYQAKGIVEAMLEAGQVHKAEIAGAQVYALSEGE